MNHFFYFLISAFACLVGTLGGMGGGIILKPAMDMVGEYTLLNISMLASMTVLVMTSVSIYKTRQHIANFPKIRLFYLAISSVCGGLIGGKIFTLLVDTSGGQRLLGIAQTVFLMCLIIGVIIYEINKRHIHHHRLEHPFILMGLGMILGSISSFLGIGGGPFNKPALHHFLGLSIKGATVGSLTIVLFSQISNIVRWTLVYGIEAFNFSLFPYLAVGAIIGGYLGGLIVNIINEHYYDYLFIGVLSFVLLINGFNLLQYTHIINFSLH